MKFHRIPVGLLLVFATVAASGWQSGNLLEFATATCQDWDGTAGPAPGFANGAVVESEIRFRETTVGTRYRFEVDDNARVELDVIVRAGQQRFVSSLFGEFGDPLVLLSLDADCDLQVARRINYNEHGQAINIDTLDVALEPRGEPDWLNPPLQLLERNRASL